MEDGHWTYAEWVDATADKIVTMGLALPEQHRAEWIGLQIRLALEQARRHGRSGLGDADPVTA